QRLPGSGHDPPGRPGAALRVPGTRVRERGAGAAGRLAPAVWLHRLRQGRERDGRDREDQGHAHRRRGPVPQRRAQDTHRHPIGNPAEV
ncbi:MAG: Peptidyl-prolyl cis-trans isomerase PpiA precursor, partial [uncultured Ramlibacter sp.]